MRHKTSELTGALLDAAVAMAEGYTVTGFAPSSRWGDGGPIIEREKIDLMYLPELNEWVAEPACIDGGLVWGSPTPLTAAMRAFVTAKLGSEVDLPESA